MTEGQLWELKDRIDRMRRQFDVRLADLEERLEATWEASTPPLSGPPRLKAR